MADVSVIVPIYNGEKTIAKCLESILNQTMNTIEIVCVNDGSTDNSLKILHKYACKDSRIKVVNKKNEGLVAARKTGVKEATSKYVGFVDCDDWIDSFMYEQLYAVAKEYNVDMVCSGYFLEGNYISKHFDNMQSGLYKDSSMRLIRENIIYNLSEKNVGIRAITCSKLFSRSIFLDVMNTVSDKLTIAEDKIFVLSFVMNCQSVYILHRAFYHYILNSDSMSHSFVANYLLKVNEVYTQFQKLYSHPNFTDSMRLQAEIYITELLYKGINQRMGFKNSNLLWIDPYYVKKIPNGSKLILYGGGELGETYYKQLSQRCDLGIIGCIALSNVGIAGVKSINIKELDKIEFDYILITIKNVDKSEEIKKELIEIGMPEKKILWFDQTEFFWKFADAMGYLE